MPSLADTRLALKGTVMVKKELSLKVKLLKYLLSYVSPLTYDQEL